jgi:hypothetical protein
MRDEICREPIYEENEIPSMVVIGIEEEFRA